MSIRIDWYSRLDEIESLEHQWRALESTVEGRTPLVCFDFLVPWYRYYHDRFGTPLLGAAWDGDRLVAVAPLVRHRARIGRVPVQAIELAGYDGEYGEFLVEDARPELVAHLLSSLRTHYRFDTLIFANLDVHSPHIREIVHAAAETGLAVERGDSLYAVVDLSEGYDAYSKATGHSLSRSLRKRTGRVEALGGASLIGSHFVPGARDIGAWLERTFEINDRSWKAKERGPLAEQHRAYFRDLCGRFARRGMLDVSVLRFGERDVAYMIGIAERGVYYDISVSYDDEFSPLSPGFRLMEALLRTLPAFGIRQVISHGAHEYKRRWASRFAPGVRLFLFPASPRATLSRLLKFRVAPVLGRTDPIWD